MCPAVWPGVSSTRAVRPPTLAVTPSPTVASTAGIRAASLRGAVTRQLWRALSSAIPPVWSAWWWVTRMSLSFQPVVRSAVSTGPASGASIAAVAPVAGSCTSTPKLSLRQRNRWVWADILRFPIVNSGTSRIIRLRAGRRNTADVRDKMGHVLRRRRPARVLQPAARHRGAPLRRPRHPGALGGYARTARARGRLCDALSRAVSRGGGAPPRLHAGGAGRGEVAVGQSDAHRAGRRVRAAARRFLGRSRAARACARDVARRAEPLARGLACAGGRRAADGGGAEPARPVGADRYHAVRAWPALFA